MIYQPDSTEFRTMLRAYQGCLLWTMSGPDGDENPGDRYTPERFTAAARTVCVADCLEFLNRVQNAGLAPWVWQTSDAYALPGYGPEQFGHDLALSRNEHGAGFFDRSALDRPLLDILGKPRPGLTLGDTLQDIARCMGSRDVYPACGWIYCS